MKCLGKRAEAIFRQLIEGLTEPGQHRKIDNTAGTFAGQRTRRRWGGSWRNHSFMWMRPRSS